MFFTFACALCIRTQALGVSSNLYVLMDLILLLGNLGIVFVVFGFGSHELFTIIFPPPRDYEKEELQRKMEDEAKEKLRKTKMRSYLSSISLDFDWTTDDEFEEEEDEKKEKEMKKHLLKDGLVGIGPIELAGNFGRADDDLEELNASAWLMKKLERLNAKKEDVKQFWLGLEDKQQDFLIRRLKKLRDLQEREMTFQLEQVRALERAAQQERDALAATAATEALAKQVRLDNFVLSEMERLRGLVGTASSGSMLDDDEKILEREKEVVDEHDGEDVVNLEMETFGRHRASISKLLNNSVGDAMETGAVAGVGGGPVLLESEEFVRLKRMFRRMRVGIDEFEPLSIVLKPTTPPPDPEEVAAEARAAEVARLEADVIVAFERKRAEAMVALEKERGVLALLEAKRASAAVAALTAVEERRVPEMVAAAIPKASHIKPGLASKNRHALNSSTNFIEKRQMQNLYALPETKKKAILEKHISKGVDAAFAAAFVSKDTKGKRTGKLGKGGKGLPKHDRSLQGPLTPPLIVYKTMPLTQTTFSSSPSAHTEESRNYASPNAPLLTIYDHGNDNSDDDDNDDINISNNNNDNDDENNDNTDDNNDDIDNGGGIDDDDDDSDDSSISNCSEIYDSPSSISDAEKEEDEVGEKKEGGGQSPSIREFSDLDSKSSISSRVKTHSPSVLWSRHWSLSKSRFYWFHRLNGQKTWKQPLGWGEEDEEE